MMVTVWGDVVHRGARHFQDNLDTYLDTLDTFSDTLKVNAIDLPVNCHYFSKKVVLQP